MGPNAVGKTNVVEGIQLMTALTSFRHPTIDQLTLDGAPFARIDAEATDGKRQLELGMQIADGKKKHILNGKVKRPADLKGLIPSVTFTPDDLNLAKGSMSVRRAALDTLGSQLSANHYLIRRDYEKVLRYKNRLLKEEAPDTLIESINESLITCGAQLTCYRAALVEKLAPCMSTYYESISESREQLEAWFEPSWNVLNSHTHTFSTTSLSRDEAREALSQALIDHAEDERQRRRALVGPHADRLEFTIGGRDAGVFGSQGQQRSLVLSFKLAEATLIQEILHQKPILLLDDVMSELDASRRSALMSFIAGDIQTFITTTNLSYFDDDILQRARIVQLPQVVCTEEDEVSA